MGTRGAFGFFHNGQTKVTYNHFDSYPEGLGKHFIADLLLFDTEQLAGAAERLTLVDEEVPPTPDLIERYQHFTDLRVSGQRATDWYCLLRHAQGTIAPYVDGTIDHMIDSAVFLGYSLFCEWAYVFNTATNKVEVYHGFNVSTPEARDGRYAAVEKRDGNYYGVRLLTELDFLGLCRAVGHATQAGVPLDTAIDIVADGAVGVIEDADKALRPHLYAHQEG